MRIGIVLHDFALGGTERIAVRLAEVWASAGVEVEIFCGSEGGPIRPMVAQSVRVVEANPPIPRGFRSLHKLATAAAQHFTDRQVQGVFVPGNFHWPVIKKLAKIRPDRRPRIVAQISSALHKRGRRGLRQYYFEARSRRRLAGADVVVGLSDQSAKEAQEILGRWVDVARLPVLQDQPHPPAQFLDGDPLIVAAGRFVHQKDFATLVEAFAKLRHKSADLAIIGDGPQYRRIARRVKALGLEERVFLPGYLQDIRPWLDRSRLFVLSSRHEGYGAVIVEALAAGRPVVTTDCTPASHELLRDEAIGMVVPIADPTALANAMDAMLDRPAPAPSSIAKSVEPWRIGPIATDYLDLFHIVPNVRDADDSLISQTVKLAINS